MSPLADLRDYEATFSFFFFSWAWRLLPRPSCVAWEHVIILFSRNSWVLQVAEPWQIALWRLLCCAGLASPLPGVHKWVPPRVVSLNEIIVPLWLLSQRQLQQGHLLRPPSKLIKRVFSGGVVCEAILSRLYVVRFEFILFLTRHSDSHGFPGQATQLICLSETNTLKKAYKLI